MYVILNDYQRVIQTSELNAITGSVPSIRVMAEQSTQEEIRSYLIQKFDLTTEFQDTQLYNPAAIYKATNRIYLDASDYNPVAGVYALNALTLQLGTVYICTTAILAPEPFTAGKWTALGLQYDIFYVPFPAPLFDQKKLYMLKNPIWWKDFIYVAKQGSTPETHEGDLQAINIESIIKSNIFPDDLNTAGALQAWGVGIPYSFTGILPINTPVTAWSGVTAYVIGNQVSYAGINYQAVAPTTNIIPGTDITKWAPVSWIKGDNRNQLFVKKYLDMVVYMLCARIAPNNVPEIRHNNWVQAIKDWKAFAEGDRTAELPLIQPKQGAPIRWGGLVARNNNW